jgi:hypothetical protein
LSAAAHVTEDIVGMIVTAQDEQIWRLERLRRVEAELANDVRRKITRLHDHKGVLFVNWTERPNIQEIAGVTDVWGRHENDPVTYHFEMGVELVGAALRYNPFDGSDHSHLAAIELLRSARDLLKKTGVLMKKNGSRPHGVRRLFQAVKLTESTATCTPLSSRRPTDWRSGARQVLDIRDVRSL